MGAFTTDLGDKFQIGVVGGEKNQFAEISSGWNLAKIQRVDWYGSGGAWRKDLLLENVHKFVDVGGKGISLSFFSVLPLGGRDQSKKLEINCVCSLFFREPAMLWDVGGGRGGGGRGGGGGTALLGCLIRALGPFLETMWYSKLTTKSSPVCRHRKKQMKNSCVPMCELDCVTMQPTAVCVLDCVTMLHHYIASDCNVRTVLSQCFIATMLYCSWGGRGGGWGWGVGG